HATERAEAKYYKVDLDDYSVKAELTTTMRVGLHQYTFPETNDAHIILDMMHGIYNYPGKNQWSAVHVINDTTVVGYRRTSGWARNRTLYFAMVFSKPFDNYGMKRYSKEKDYRGFWWKFNEESNFPFMEGKQIRTFFNFKT